MTVAAELADYLTSTHFDDLPPLAVERAQMIIASTLASAAAGSEISSTNMIRDLEKERGGAPEASIWFDAGPKLPIADVARVNAVMSDSAASDDSDLRNIAHIGTIVTATSLAMAERTGASGRDVLAAMVLGYEIAGRIGEAATPGYGERGFHGCVVTIFGGTVATGTLLHLSRPQMAQAIAIAATSIGGLGMAANTSLAREYHAGLSAMLGVNAAMAAQKGYIAEESVLEGSHGYFETFGGHEVESVTRDLGKTWDITTHMGIKLVPGAHSYHAAAEAATSAAITGVVDPDAVEAITVSGPQFSALRGPVHPDDLIGAAHSLPHFLASAVADRDFSWVHAGSEKLSDPRIARLREKVRVDGPYEGNLKGVESRYGATVTIKTRDGASFSSTVGAPRGSGARGIEWADVDAKFRTLTAATLPLQRIDGCLNVIHRLDRLTAISELAAMLH